MRAGIYLNLVRAFPVATLSELVGREAFVVLSPHPDDETLGVGGLIALACAQNRDVKVIVATDGSGSHPNSKTHSPQRLKDVRYAEVEQAGGILGLPVENMVFLGLTDTSMPTSGPPFQAAVDQILAVLAKSDARSLFVTWECDPHCDHEASAELAKAVRKAMPGLKVWAYPIWGWHLDENMEIAQPIPVGYRVDISERLSQKMRAIAAHASQMTDLIADDATGFRFTEKTLAPFIGQFEYFIEVPA